MSLTFLLLVARLIDRMLWRRNLLHRGDLLIHEWMFSLHPDSLRRIETRVREINTPEALCFTNFVSRRFSDQHGLHGSFIRILSEYTYGWIDHVDMYHQVSKLFSARPEMIKRFARCFPQANSNKRANEHDYAETLRSAKKAKTEDGSSKAITVLDPTSIASTSYASNYSQSPCSSASYQHEWEAVASCSSSSSSRPGNVAQAYEAHQKKNSQFIDGTLYVTETETRYMDAPQAYELLAELVNEIGANRTDIYAIMESASTLLEGYPELIETFNLYLPDGYRIEIISDDHEMSTD